MRIHKNGYVGIGNNNPTERLHVDGNIIANILTGSELRINTNVIYANSTNVGIGTTTPSYKLDVNGSIKGDTLAVTNGITANGITCTTLNVNGTSITGGATSQWTTSGTNIFYNSGNIGIGTSFPSEKLYVNGNIRCTDVIASELRVGTNLGTGIGTICTTGGTVGIYTSPSTTNTLYKLDVNGGIQGNSLTVTNGITCTTLSVNGTPITGGSSQWTTSGTNIFYNLSGNVGIGTTAPAYKFDVNGSIKGDTLTVANGITCTNGDINLNANRQAVSFTAGNDKAWIFMEQNGADANDGSLYICTGNDSSEPIIFCQGTNTLIRNEKMRIHKNGYVGIGDNNPGTPLSVKGNVGGVTIWAENDIVAYSDARVKTNLKTIDNALEKVCSISGYTFERTDETHSNAIRYAGVLAQEVQTVLPEVVRADAQGMLSVAYGNMVPLLIEAVKDLKKELDELKNRA
jgi:hypothetical protein